MKAINIKNKYLRDKDSLRHENRKIVTTSSVYCRKIIAISFKKQIIKETKKNKSIVLQIDKNKDVVPQQKDDPSSTKSRWWDIFIVLLYTILPFLIEKIISLFLMT